MRADLDSLLTLQIYDIFGNIVKEFPALNSQANLPTFTFMTAIETQDISKIYRQGIFKRKNIRALNKVSLEVRKGEIFGLLGPNGAGKTTFVKLLLSIVHPTSGSASLFGHPLADASARAQCGYLPENHRYPPFLNGLDTILLFGRLSRRISDLKDRAMEVLTLVGLKDWSGVAVKKYSKGMLQRLGLAQAIVDRPALLFLDEPTDGVDPVGRKEIRDILRDLRRNGTTIFLNSHLLSEVETVCDRVAILKNGEVLKTGTIAELTARDFTHEIMVDKPIPQSLIGALNLPSHRLAIEGHRMYLHAQDPIQLNAVVDQLRARHFSLISITPHKSSLEDAFLELLKEGNKTTDGGVQATAQMSP